MKMLEESDSSYRESKEDFHAKGYQVGTSNEEGEFIAEEPDEEFNFEEMSFEDEDDFGDDK